MKIRYMVCFLLALILLAAPALGEGYDSAALTDFVIASPGESGYDVQQVLAAAKGMGFLKEISSTEENYRDKYIDGIKKMEETYGLTADGVMMSSEWKQLSEMKYPGMQGEAIKGMLERLSDLGFITTTLPETHDKYQQTYVSAVKKAEKEYKLTEDGILTKEEWKTISNKRIPQPAAPTNVKASLSGTTATITWNSVKGARYYEVYRDSEAIGTTKGTSFSDKNLQVGNAYFYTVKACKYTVKSIDGYAEDSVTVFRKPNAKELTDNYSKWTWQYVKMDSTSYVSKKWEGSDLYYIVRKNYNDRAYYFYVLLADARNWDGDSNGKHVYDYDVYQLNFEGYCSDEYKYSSYGNLPVIDLSYIYYWYN